MNIKKLIKTYFLNREKEKTYKELHKFLLEHGFKIPYSKIRKIKRPFHYASWAEWVELFNKYCPGREDRFRMINDILKHSNTSGFGQIVGSVYDDSTRNSYKYRL